MMGIFLTKNFQKFSSKMAELTVPVNFRSFRSANFDGNNTLVENGFFAHETIAFLLLGCEKIQTTKFFYFKQFAFQDILFLPKFPLATP